MSDYMKPLVLVYQEIRNTSATLANPTLPGIVIGPCYQLMNYDDDKDNIYVGMYDYTVDNTFSAPSPIPGMEMVEEDLEVTLDNVNVKITEGSDGVSYIAPITDLNKYYAASASFITDKTAIGDSILISSDVSTTGDGSTSAGTANFSSASASFVTWGVEKGDVITISGTDYMVDSVTGESSLVLTTVFPTTETTLDAVIHRVRGRKVLSVVSEDTLLLSKNVGFAATGATYVITRELDDRVLDASFYTADYGNNSVTVNLGATLLVDAVNLPIVTGKMYLGYKALRTDVAARPISITKEEDIVNNLGKIVPANPLAFGAKIAFDNAASTISALGVNSDDSNGYSEARDIITDRNVYVIMLLTQDASIIATFKAHCEAKSAPEKNQFRICIGNHSLPTTKTLQESAIGATLTDPDTSKIIFFDDASAEFMTDDIAPGDSIEIVSGPLASAGPYIIDSVVNENRLKIMVADEFVSEEAPLNYTITRALSKDQQAAEIEAKSNSLGSKRCLMTYPNIAVVDDVELSGIYLNCILGGMICGLPAQAGLTNKGAAAVDGIKNSNFYFTDDQLDTIASGGTCIFVQQSENSLPYVRHQLTTDMTSLETKEISVVKNNDYLSIFFRDIVKKYLGEWNVTPELLDVLSQAISAGIEFQILSKIEKIGAPLIDATIETLEVSEISADRVEIFIDTTQPRPLNNIGLHMIL